MPRRLRKVEWRAKERCVFCKLAILLPCAFLLQAVECKKGRESDGEPDQCCRCRIAIDNAAAVKNGFAKQRPEVLVSTPEEMARHIASENAKWTRIIVEAGIKAN